MSTRLHGRTAVVTGGGSGLGAAACQRFAAEGANVVVADLDPTSAEATARRIRAEGGVALAVAGDVALAQDNEAIIQAALEAYGRLDVLLCNAGVPAVGTAVRTDRDVWDRAIAVMLTGAWLGMRAALPSMVERGSGSIILQSSVAGLVGIKALAPYTAAKAGLLGLARQVAVDFAPHNIRVNAICPGDVPTPLTAATFDAQVASGLKRPRPATEVLERARSHYPLGRLGRAEDVANMATFLASDESAWITGQVFVVDGGLVAS